MEGRACVAILRTERAWSVRGTVRRRVTGAEWARVGKQRGGQGPEWEPCGRVTASRLDPEDTGGL